MKFGTKEIGTKIIKKQKQESYHDINKYNKNTKMTRHHRTRVHTPLG